MMPRSARVARTWTAVAAAALLGACVDAPPEPGTGGMGLRVQLPAEAAKFYRPAQDEELDISTEGRILIELRRNNVVHRWAMVDPDAGSVVLRDIAPASDYRLEVYEGLPANARDLGVVRFAAIETGINIPPDEVLSTSVRLTRCDERDDVPAGLAELCNPEFGTGDPAPSPPRIFPVPALSGCDEYVVAGTKPAETVLIDNNATLIDGSTDPNWIFDLTSPLGGPTSSEQVSRSLRTARADDQQNRSDQVSLTFNYRPDAVCFNAYDVVGGTSDIAGTTAELQLTWEANGRAGDLGIVVRDDLDADPATVLTALPSAGGAVLNVVTVAATDEAATFARPTTDAYHVLLYADTGATWNLEGAFTYDPDWLIAAGHASLP